METIESLVAAVTSAGVLRRHQLSQLPELRGLRPIQIEALIQRAIGDGLLTDNDGVLRSMKRVVPDKAFEDRDDTASTSMRPWRVVAIDFESVVRPTSRAPYLDRRPYQVAALRFGRDQDWVLENEALSLFCQLPPDDGEDIWLIQDPAIAERHSNSALSRERWIAELDQFLRGADAIVAYNGDSFDFPLLDEERGLAGLPPLPAIEKIDGLLLAVSLWPNPPRNTSLSDLAARLGIDLTGLTWHEALSDCRILAAICNAAGNTLRALDANLTELVLSVAGDSPTWALIADLAEIDADTRVFTPDEVVEVLGVGLEALGTPRRRNRQSSPVDLDDSLLHEGNVDPQRLAELLHDQAPVRQAQGQMSSYLKRWLRDNRGGLVEAPTGTGKSLVLLAAALDWVRADPENQAIIATHTRQLQSQLAQDVQELSERGLVALGRNADLIKGASNRLSLRALTLELADSTSPAERRQIARELREFLIFLLMRLVTANRLTEQWEARSVDSVDVPMVFANPSSSRLAGWLHRLSQREHGEFGADPETIASLHTDRVPEALAASRIVIANHALLLAHRREISERAEHLAIFVDEGHDLEGAATEALSLTLDYQSLEHIPGSVRRLVRECPRHPALDRAAQSVERLERYLATSIMPKAANDALDQLSETEASLGQRAVTLASPYVGRRISRPTEALRAGLERTARELTYVHRCLAAYAAEPDGLERAGRWSAERFFATSALVVDQESAVGPIVAALDEILGPRRREHMVRGDTEVRVPDFVPEDEATLARFLQIDLPATDSARTGESSTTEHDVAALPDDFFEEDEADEDFDEDATNDVVDEVLDEEVVDDVIVGVDAEPPILNYVIFLNEGQSPLTVASEPRDLHFSITSSPISLGSTGEWHRFIDITRRFYLTSGTLCVSGRFDYIRDRLGLPVSMGEVVLDTPFDLARQARLYCLSDFPSWAEHPIRAVRSVAHQVCGFVERSSAVDDAGAVTGGAMVLTTSKATAAAISEAAAPRLAAHGIPMATTEILGNARAVEFFAQDGGVLVGTRGLWQGVDVRDSRRLRLVWINKLPFAPFASPLVVARRARAVERAELAGDSDPERSADESYYLPLAALALRQAVGRLIRSVDHRGVIVISDAKLAGNDPRHRIYRRVFLGSLEPGLRRDAGQDVGSGNVMTMAEAWRDALSFGVHEGFVETERAPEINDDDALSRFVDLPEMSAVRAQLLDEAETERLRSSGQQTLVDEVLERCQRLARVLGGPDHVLHPEQRAAIEAVTRGNDLLALLPTGFGKSYCYQLPGLVLPGVTLVVSPLVSLMVDQAMGLGSVVGPMVRALTGPMRESNSRMGKSQVAETLRGENDHGIRLIYLSPERLADARFRTLVREGVARGVVARIAVDEAHCLVDWGDDFRPSYRRLDKYLSQLKAEFPSLQISALTATANASVRAGLRSRLFALPPERPSTGDRANFTTIEANPLRPELAIWRRRLGPRSGGANAVAGLTEAIVDSLNHHAIFYCLTVREVEVLSASLREYLGEAQGDRVLQYHGRLSSAEKAAVSLAFRTAPRVEETEDFRPLIVVATSAFGLGVDRGDIRAVFCVSPPTDLGALYQQLGRAGRDCTHKIPGRDDVPTNAAMALVTPRSWRTLTWMANQDLPLASLLALADRILSCAPPGGFAAIDPAELAIEQLDSEIAAGQRPDAANRTARIRDELESGVIRVLAALAAADGVDDLGDIPDRVRVRAGEIDCDDPLWNAILTHAIASADSGDIDLVPLHESLAASPDYVEACPTPADLWTGLAAAHDHGWLDVSQQSTRTHMAIFQVLSSTRPTRLEEELLARRARISNELTRLHDWFDDDRCAHLGFAESFGVTELPEGSCDASSVRCSAHWNSVHAAGSTEVAPTIFDAFFTPRPQASASTAEGRAAFERRLRKHLGDLLWMHPRGLHERMLWRVLHGEDWWFDQRRGRWRRLWPSLLYHRSRGSMRGIRPKAIHRVLEQMQETGDVVATGGGFYRLAPYVEQDAARAARNAKTVVVTQ
jgi:RecQ family ATP-dependent DNA helicase